MSLDNDMYAYMRSKEFFALGYEERSEWMRKNQYLLSIDAFERREFPVTVWGADGSRYDIVVVRYYSGEPVFVSDPDHHEDDRWEYPLLRVQRFGLPQNFVEASQQQAMHARIAKQRESNE